MEVKGTVSPSMWRRAKGHSKHLAAVVIEGISKREKVAHGDARDPKVAAITSQNTAQSSSPVRVLSFTNKPIQNIFLISQKQVNFSMCPITYLGKVIHNYTNYRDSLWHCEHA